MKGTQTNKNSKGVEEFWNSRDHAYKCDLSGPYLPCLKDQRYLFSFIDNHTWYIPLYLIDHKDEALDVFKNYKIEVEK